MILAIYSYVIKTEKLLIVVFLDKHGGFRKIIYLSGSSKCFGADKYPVSCYIRPDFIYNYIAKTYTQKR